MAFDTFQDGRDIPDGQVIDTDLCIVGSGAAGITLAQSFANSGLRVTLLEAGGLSIDPDVDANSSVEDAGRRYSPDATRLRYFGGTTNHWGGHCVPLEPEDFEAKSWISGSGWPITRSDLDPYYARAHDVVGIGSYDYDAARISAELGGTLMPFDGTKVATQLSRYRRQRYGFAYGDTLDGAANIQVILYGDVSEIVLAQDTGRAVSHLTVQSPAMNSFQLRARAFVLAAGGIENARLLLMSNTQRPAGLGNENDHVGRYFQDHLWYPSGIMVPFEAPVERLYTEEVPYDGAAVRCHLILSAAEAERQGVGRFRTELLGLSETGQQLRRLQSGEIVMADIADLALKPITVGNTFACQGDQRNDAYRFQNYIQQVPNPDSRITLSQARDAYGRPQARLDWRISRLDQDCIVKAHQIIAQEAGRLGFGRVRIEVEEDPDILLDGVLGGAHHMGTTRMSASASEGVCNADCRVHSVDNLYLAGSSVFPTCGYPNPTLTITAMALRLADHLETRATREGWI